MRRKDQPVNAVQENVKLLYVAANFLDVKAGGAHSYHYAF
jgi:hypothetical protein